MSVGGWAVTPFPERKYDKDRFSEGISIAPSTRHNTRYKNNFEYKIMRGNTVVESGAFTVNVNVQTQTLKREAMRIFERYCTTGGSLDKCKERAIAIREIKHCP